MTETTTTSPTAEQNGQQPVTETPTGNPPTEINPATGRRRRVASADPKPTAPARRASAKTGNPQTDRAARTAKASPKPTAKAEPKQTAPKAPKPDLRAGKRELATRVVLAAAEMVKSLSATDLKAIGMTKAEAAVAVSSWIHHIPADREQWVKVLPKPDRSDWR